MIVSHEHKYVFIKTPKTAGTSLEIALSKYCGPDDIITPISPRDEASRRALGHARPQNYTIPRRRWSARDHVKWLAGKGPPAFFNHASASYMRRYLPGGVWEDYFTFCFERNPWDKAISRYYWDHREDPAPDLSAYIRDELPHKRRGWDLYTIDGRVAVDRVYLFEELDEAVSDLSERFGFAQGLDLPRAKSGHRPGRAHYTALLDDGQRNAIAALFSEEIEAFGYTFSAEI